MIEVDDVLEAGDEEHRRRMKVLEEKLRFGKAVELQSEDFGTGYAGRRIRQEQDCSFTHSMQDYVQNRLKQVILENKTLKKNASEVPLTANEETQLRGTIASINWIAREGRPDASAAASILAGCFPNPTAENALEANRVVNKINGHNVVLRIFSIYQGQDPPHLDRGQLLRPDRQAEAAAWMVAGHHR